MFTCKTCGKLLFAGTHDIDPVHNPEYCWGHDQSNEVPERVTTSNIINAPFTNALNQANLDTVIRQIVREEIKAHEQRKIQAARIATQEKPW